MERTNEQAITSDGIRTRLHLDSRAELDAYLKSLPAPKPGNVRVFRGQVRDYGTLIPSSLRAENWDDRWFRAYCTLVATRLRENAEELDETSAWVIWSMALAQHYSIGSPYLDVTKDVDVALWFASHQSESHHELLVLGPAGPLDPLTDFPAQLEFTTFRPSSEPIAYLYVLDVPLWGGGGHPKHGDLIDLTRAPAVFANAPRIQAQAGNLIYGERTVAAGDLSSFLVAPPIEVPTTMTGKCSNKTTRDVFPPVARDPWYEALVSIPLSFDTPDNRHLVPRLSIPVGLYFDNQEELKQLKQLVTLLAVPLLGPYLRSEQKRGEQWLHVEVFPEDALNIIVNDPLYFVTPPLGEGWNEAVVMADLPAMARVSNREPGDSDEVSLSKVLVEFSPLEYGFWGGLESQPDVKTVRRAIYMERDDQNFRVWDFTQTVPIGPITCLGPVALRFNPGKKGFVLGDNLSPAEIAPVLFKNFLLVLGLTLFDRPGLMIAGRAEPRQNPDREDPGFVRVRPHPARVG